jgi:hypothetical protein
MFSLNLFHIGPTMIQSSNICKSKTKLQSCNRDKHSSLYYHSKDLLYNIDYSSQNDEGGTLRDRLEDLRVKLQDVINLVSAL